MKPSRPGVAMADYQSALFGAFAILVFGNVIVRLWWARHHLV